MKNIYLFISLFCLSLFQNNSYAQKIAYDDIMNDGKRIIGTEGIDEKIQDASYTFRLSVQSFLDTKIFHLIVGSLWTMDNASIILIRLGNDEVVKLIPLNSNISQIDYPKFNPIVGSTGNTGLLSTQKVNYFVSVYNLDYDLLNRIKQFGIVKLRISFGNSFFEKNWKKDELGKFLKKCHIQLENQIKKPHISSKSIEDDF
jgi:hypothetical protein